jgi:hypothetical protein
MERHPVRTEWKAVKGMNSQTDPWPKTAVAAASPVEQAQAKAQDVAERAQEAAGQAQVKLRDQIDQRSTQLGEQVTASASALRFGADELYRQGNHAAADATQRAAAQAERLGSYLQATDAHSLLADAEDVARRNPWAVVVGGVLAGGVAARLLKASSSRRFEQYQGAPRLEPSHSSVMPASPVSGAPL